MYGKTHIRFAAMAMQSNSNLGIQVSPTAWTDETPIAMCSDYGHSPITGAWTVYTIPLDVLGATEGIYYSFITFIDIDGFVGVQFILFSDQSGAHSVGYYVDQIEFMYVL